MKNFILSILAIAVLVFSIVLSVKVYADATSKAYLKGQDSIKEFIFNEYNKTQSLTIQIEGKDIKLVPEK